MVISTTKGSGGALIFVDWSMHLEHKASVPHPQFDATGRQMSELVPGLGAPGECGSTAEESGVSHWYTKTCISSTRWVGLSHSMMHLGPERRDLRNGDFFCSWAWMEGEGSHTTEMSVVPCW